MSLLTSPACFSRGARRAVLCLLRRRRPASVVFWVGDCRSSSSCCCCSCCCCSSSSTSSSSFFVSLCLSVSFCVSFSRALTLSGVSSSLLLLACIASLADSVARRSAAHQVPLRNDVSVRGAMALPFSCLSHTHTHAHALCLCLSVSLSCSLSLTYSFAHKGCSRCRVRRSLSGSSSCSANSIRSTCLRDLLMTRCACGPVAAGSSSSCAASAGWDHRAPLAARSRPRVRCSPRAWHGLHEDCARRGERVTI